MFNKRYILLVLLAAGLVQGQADPSNTAIVEEGDTVDKVDAAPAKTPHENISTKRSSHQHAKASLLMGASDEELSKNGYEGCKFASNLEVNVLYCDGGKLIVQDSIEEDNVQHYLLPKKVRDTLATVNGKRFKFF